MTFDTDSFSILDGSQILVSFDSVASDLLLEQARPSILTWNPGPRRVSGCHRESHRWEMAYCCFTSFFNMKISRASSLWLIFVGAPHCSTSTLSNPTQRSRRSTSPRTQHIARFQRISRNGKSSFAVMSLHCKNAVAKHRSKPFWLKPFSLEHSVFFDTW